MKMWLVTVGAVVALSGLLYLPVSWYITSLPEPTTTPAPTVAVPAVVPFPTPFPTVTPAPTQAPMLRQHRVVGITPDNGVAAVQSYWSYAGITLTLGTAEPSALESHEGAWTCFRAVVVTADTMGGDIIYLLVNHGERNKLCFKNLERTNWHGPVEELSE